MLRFHKESRKANLENNDAQKPKTIENLQKQRLNKSEKNCQKFLAKEKVIKKFVTA